MYWIIWVNQDQDYLKFPKTKKGPKVQVARIKVLVDLLQVDKADQVEKADRVDKVDQVKGAGPIKDLVETAPNSCTLYLALSSSRKNPRCLLL